MFLGKDGIMYSGPGLLAAIYRGKSALSSHY